MIALVLAALALSSCGKETIKSSDLESDPARKEWVKTDIFGLFGIGFYKAGVNYHNSGKGLYEIGTIMATAVLGDGGGNWETATVDLSPKSVVTKISEETASAIDDLKENPDLSSVTEAIIALAMGVLVFLWGANLVTKVVEERFTFETFIKSFLFLIIGVVFIDNATEIVSLLIKLGEALIPKSTGTTNLPVTDYITRVSNHLNESLVFVKANKGLGDLFKSGADSYEVIYIGLPWLLSILMLLIPFIAVLLCAFQIVTQMIMRIIELVVRLILAPIPIAWSAYRGFNEGISHFLKSTFACIMQPVIIVVACIAIGTIVEVILNTLNATNGKWFIQMIALAFAYFSLSQFIGKSDFLSKEIIGR